MKKWCSCSICPCRPLQPLQVRRTLSVLKSTAGGLLTKEEGIAQELCKYCGGIMRPMLTSNSERKDHLNDLPKRCRDAGEKLWQEPTLSMVYEAPGVLDQASSLWHDGFTGAFYKACGSCFAPMLLDVIRELGSTGRLPKEWCEGMTRCVPKEQGCISVDK